MECAAAQVCREAGARVSTNVHVRDLDLTGPQRWSTAARSRGDGLSLWHGAQLAIDTTLVCLHSDGSAKEEGCRQ